MKTSSLINGAKTLSDNVKKALAPKKIKPEEQEQRFYERRFVELEAMSGKIQKAKKSSIVSYNIYIKRWWE